MSILERLAYTMGGVGIGGAMAAHRIADGASTRSEIIYGAVWTFLGPLAMLLLAAYVRRVWGASSDR